MSRSPASGTHSDSRLALQLLLILGTGILAWSNSLTAPFVFDDLTTIVDNPLIRTPGRFLSDPSLFLAEPRRFLGYLTFALNYRFGGLDSTGYHAVNLALHICSALALYALVRSLSRNDPADTFPAPLAASLLFVAHPVQTQAVTYITQRFTVLATLFCILALLCYAIARQGEMSGRGLAWYGAGIAAAACAMFSKEIAFSLPVAVILLEFCLFPGDFRRSVLLCAPFAALLGIPLLMLAPATDPELLLLKRVAASGSPTPALAEYLLTQPAVFATYLRLLFLPINQTLDYDYPITRSLAEPGAITGLVLLLSLAGLALCLSRGKEFNRRLAGFGILWFLISLSVEAATPLADLINEHRLYLPSAGAALCIASLLRLAAPRMNPRMLKRVFLGAVLLLAAATWKRNLAWSDEMLLWSDAVAKAPGKARPHYNLGTVLSARGLTTAAEQEFLAALAIEPAHARARYNLGVLKYARGDVAGARADYEASLRIDPTLAEAYNSMGALLSAEGRVKEAIGYFREAIRIAPLRADSRNNLGAALAAAGDTAEAMKEFREAVRFDPSNRAYRENLERALQIDKVTK